MQKGLTESAPKVALSAIWGFLARRIDASMVAYQIAMQYDNSKATRQWDFCI